MTGLRMILTSIAAASLSAASAAQSPGGSCVGNAFLSAPEGSRSTEGPDFTVQHFRTAVGTVGIYVGCCSQVSDAKRKRFTSVDGQTVYRVSEDGQFRGYLIEQIRKFEDTDWHTQYHFFGAGFVDASSDKAFFERLSFVAGKTHNCGNAS